MITNQEAIDCIKAIHVQMFNDGNTKWTEACDMAIKALHGEPDGEWIEQDGWDGDPYYDCPICGQSYSGDFGDPEELGWHYCPECGAHLIGIKRRETDDEPEEEEEPPKRIICPNCKSDRICWDGDYGHEGAIVQEYTCKDCGARIECYVERESESDATTIETEQEETT